MNDQFLIKQEFIKQLFTLLRTAVLTIADYLSNVHVLVRRMKIVFGHL